jgi:pantoate--beta-alanine ligase
VTTPPVLRSVADLSATVSAWKDAGARVGVVPTMGALHEGHLSLVRAARVGADRVIVTIFVNPAQFNNPDDLAKYPRTEEADLALLAPLGVDAVFSPPPDQVYPPGFATRVSVAGISDPLEGAFRPGHFDGVATVVAKLFGMTRADRAWFGQKDWQQLMVVRRMVDDLNIPVEVIGAETVREGDGLALSSRNARLSPAARAQAVALPQAMRAVSAAVRAGADPTQALEAARAAILAGGFASIDYLEIREAATLGPWPGGDVPARILAAATVGGVRLIDNIAL